MTDEQDITHEFGRELNDNRGVVHLFSCRCGAERGCQQTVL